MGVMEGVTGLVTCVTVLLEGGTLIGQVRRAVGGIQQGSGAVVNVS